MQLDATFYNLLMEASGAIWAALAAARPEDKPQEPPPPLLQLRRGRAESPAWFLVQAAEFDPRPLSVARLRLRDIYAAPRLVGALLELMASERWLSRIGDDEYTLAPAGRRLLARMREEREAALAALPPPAGVDVGRLASLLQRLIEASEEADDPPGTWCLAHSRNRAPDPDAPPFIQLPQYFADFNAFRDDAHMAAWRPYGVKGHTWEAFAFLCTGRAGSAAELGEQLHYRGYDESEYAATLAELARRGWLAAESGRYTVTAAGHAAHAEAETRTDDYFYTPWAVLSAEEVATLHTLLRHFRDALQKSKRE